MTLLVDYSDSEHLISDYTENLSMGGTFVLTERVMKVGTRVQLRLSCPGLIEPIALSGVIRWCREGTDVESGVGIEFDPYDDVVRDRLARIIQAIRAGDRSVISRIIDLLIVEDNRHVVNLLRDGLCLTRSLGDVAIRFHTAADGGEAIELIDRHRFDAAIVDMYLPIVDGASLISAIRKSARNQYLKVVAISAGGREAADAALEAGADRFLSKPIRLREVAQAIGALTGA